MTDIESIFDPTSFLETAVEGTTTASVPACPEGIWPFTITGFGKEVRTWVSEGEKAKDQYEDGSPKQSAIVDVMLESTDEELCEESGRTPTKCKGGIFVNLLQNGKPDPENNSSLGHFREACDMNEEDFQWLEVVGMELRGKVVHSDNPQDTDNPYANVDAYYPAE